MRSRNVWFSAAVFSFALLFLTLLSPSVFSQGKDDKSASNERYMQLLQYVYGFVQKNYVDEVDPKVLYEGAMKGMLDALKDPYTTYIDSASLMGMSLKDTTTGSFGGVGLFITKPLESTAEKPAFVEVTSPIEDTPGWKAGIQPGDLIMDIDGKNTAEITMEDVLARLRGPVGTYVTVKIRRGKIMEFPVTMQRARIEVPTVKFAMMDDGIAYLRIIEFTPITADRVAEALTSFTKAGYKGLIIDLRNNPGGLITSVVDVADKFIDKGVIVSTRSRISYENREFKATRGTPGYDSKIPVVVLLNKGSASASEILAGALKDYRIAYLVGETSYGKGSVQQIIDLLNQDGMKITMARYYTPSDANIDKKGIRPDREVLFPELSEDEQKSLAELLKTTKIADMVAGAVSVSGTLDGAGAERIARELRKAYPVEQRLLKKLVMQEFYRTHIAPLYDLEYDLQLTSAREILLKENVPELLKSTKTVRELQEEADAAAASKAEKPADEARSLVPDPVQ
jgi:carboxyl-terminal processing protease